MLELEVHIYERIIALLIPHLDSEASRRGLITPAFGSYPLHKQIDWSGDPHAFTVHLIDRCLRYSEVRPGKQALVVLLMSVRSQVGVDQQTEIDDILRQLGEATGPSGDRCSGPKCVHFMIVAGRANELTQVRADVGSYGDECFNWRPYYPDPREVAPFLQIVAGHEGLTLSWLSPSYVIEELQQALEQASKANSIVVVIVDVWSLQLVLYRTLMERYDKCSFFNCAVLIPWNGEDEETEQHRDKLERDLRETFLNKMTVKDPKSFREEIVSLDDLETELRDVLIEIRRRILETAEEVGKPVGKHVIALPGVSGPGGG